MKKQLLLSLLVLCISAATFAQPTGWLYEKPISVTNSGSQLVTNYSLAVTVNTQALINAHQMQATGADIRFGTPCTGTRIFNHYVYSGINTTTTLIYVLIDSLKPNSTRTIYMFYGNPTATSTASLSALNGPYTIFNGQNFTSAYSTLNGSSTYDIQAGTYFQPNQSLLVTALGTYSPSSSGRLLQLSSYTGGVGTVIANKMIPSTNYAQWTYVNLDTPIIIDNAHSYASSSVCTYYSSPTYLWYYYNGVIASPPASQVNVLGYAYGTPAPTNTATTAPSVYTSTNQEGFGDIKFYLLPVANSYITAQLDTAINASAWYDPVSTLQCPGHAASFSALASGVLQTYQWQVNTGTGWSNVSTGTPYTGVNSATLTVSPLTNAMNGYQYRAYMTSTCGTGYTNPATLNVNTNPAILPIVTITGPNPACAYTNALYTLTTNVTSGTYSWAKNGNTIGGATGTTYAFAPAPGDVIQATVIPPTNASIGCYVPNQAVSNAVTMSVGSNFVPHDSIAASGNNGCAGTIVDFRGYGNIYGGTYQWYVNGQPYPGATASLFSYAPNNGDQVTETITTPQNGCYSLSSATSQPLVANTVSGVTATIQLSGPATAVVGNTITITANVLNYGTGYTIVWSNGGVPFATTTNTNTIQFQKTPAATEYISARITPVSPSNNTCYSPATSNTLQIGITPYNVGVNNVANNNNISAYPNPFTNVVNVSGLGNGDMLEVYDMAGRKVGVPYKATGSTAEYTPGAMAAGHYILRVTDGDGAVKANLPLSKM